ncbi:MAG: nuclear transport factor 2 family protein [Candidatus Nitrosopolaris sp.]
MVQKFLTGVRNGDVSLLKSVVTDDVVWSLPGKSLMSGEAHGVDGILRRSETLQRYGVKIDVEHIIFGYQDVALRLHNTGKQGDKILDEYLASFLRLRENKIYRIDTFVSDVDMLNVFFS